MMELFDAFQTFICSLPANVTTTSLCVIREKAKFITPLTISNDDSSENFGKMSVVILQNLLNYHDECDIFNVSSLKLLLELIGTNDTAEPLTKSKLMLLLHVDSGACLRLPNVLPSIQVEIINCTLAGSRGFCGINKIYINPAYIRGQMSIYSTEYHPDSPIGKSVSGMDICTITIHEFGHAKLRQVTNNPNTSTPDFYSQQTCGTVNERPKFGRLCEMAFFFGQIDYWQSAADNKWDLDYFQQFIKAIESASAIPKFNSTNNYVKHFPSTTSGVDIDLGADDYYV
ncbi:unnamed protein product [Rotaria socialis]|uniref:Uncharacterized protein n=1 Tax=Rotaria socialis TaxID=392032 RepID=A0A818WLP0_9BILA|nr:unnamed protein product [Rotaria socialis]